MGLLADPISHKALEVIKVVARDYDVSPGRLFVKSPSDEDFMEAQLVAYYFIMTPPPEAGSIPRLTTTLNLRNDKPLLQGVKLCEDLRKRQVSKMTDEEQALFARLNRIEVALKNSP